MKRLWLTLITSLLLVVLAFFFALAMFFAPVGRQAVVWIEKGSSSAIIAQQLQQCHLPAHPINLWLYKKISGTTLKSGEYQLEQGWSLWQACAHIASGRVIMHKLTIPEGWTAHQIVSKLRSEPLLVGDIADCEEGSLMPETYSFARGDKRSLLIRYMQQAMDDFMRQAWLGRGPTLVLTLKDALTLASIIESETPRDSEKSTISGVFHNRLAQGMRLQSDPTVAYAITGGAKALDKPLTYADLRFDSPFNTYVFEGLPPHPIACPGKAAILAALHPAKHTYIYFVADGSGGHVFSQSYSEHTRNVQSWRRFQKKF